MFIDGLTKHVFGRKWISLTSFMLVPYNSLICKPEAFTRLETFTIKC